MSLFRELNSSEEVEFRKWARENFNPKSDKINKVWHFVVRDECQKMMSECNSDKLELVFTEYVIKGDAYVKFWGNGHGNLRMDDIYLDKLPEDLHDIEFNDGRFGCERIEDVTFEIYKSYQDHLVFQDQVTLFLKENNRSKRGL
jgi:hypothetical protein